MTSYTDFPTLESCLRCRGEERCPWHSDVRDPPLVLEKDEDHSPLSSKASSVKGGGKKTIFADLPPELFYNYNPSGKAGNTYRVLPEPSKSIWDDEEKLRWSIELNPELRKAYSEMRRNFTGAFEPVALPNLSNFKFDKYHVRYIEEEPRREWRLYLPETAPGPYECANAAAKGKTTYPK